MNRRTAHAAAGFTFAELLVGSMLLSIIMAAVYGAFSANLIAWQSGEQDMEGFRDVRLASDLMRREAQSMIGGSQHLFEGEAGAVEFFVSAPPLFLGDGAGTRIMWLRYEMKDGALVRSEAPVRRPLPPPPPPEDEEARRRTVGAIDLGTKTEFPLVRDVTGFAIEYYWMPPPAPREPETPPRPVTPIVVRRSRQGLGLPQGMKVTLQVEDPRAPSGVTTFTNFIRFYGATTPVTETLLRELGAL